MIRADLLPKECSRCGNDLMTGRAVIHLPFKKMYISFCSVCVIGLGMSDLFQGKSTTSKQWDNFWSQKIKGKNE
jgi:hypothetical protein